uniref:Carbonic anhydrase n=1 Tax=Gouania willdenowi TaxID=441366 RepID=A0A8C5ND17_GOUWI
MDPSHWAALFPSCGGLRQSPINIVSSKVHVNSALPPFDFIGHTNTLNITVENKGHSVRLTGGALPGHYRASQFHFHWGGNGNPGSEHTIDGERFPMELHIVHIKEPYGTLAEAEHDLAGIALLGFLFEVMKHPIIAALGRVQNNGEHNSTESISRELHNYYRYVGSITTPGCEQAVTWTLFHKTLAISSRQQCRFWNGQPMTNIFRPTQPLDGRVVYRSSAVKPLSSAFHLWFSQISFGITKITKYD